MSEIDYIMRLIFFKEGKSVLWFEVETRWHKNKQNKE